MKFRRILKFYFLRIIRLRDDPHRVALSLAIGTSIMFLPFFGLGVFIAYFAAFFLKINRLAAVITTIFWKWALVGFYALNYMVGKVIIGENHKIAHNAINNAVGFFGHFNFHQIGSAFLLGSVINAALSGILVYYIALKLLILRRERKTMRNNHKLAVHKGE